MVSTVWTWGMNGIGMLGDGTNIDSNLPNPVPGFGTASVVGATHATTMAVDQDGRVWAWGGNSHGQLGNGSTSSSSVPVLSQF